MMWHLMQTVGRVPLRIREAAHFCTTPVLQVAGTGESIRREFCGLSISKERETHIYLDTYAEVWGHSPCGDYQLGH